MARLEEALESAESGDDYQFQTCLAVLRRQIDGEVEIDLAVPLGLLDSTEVEHPLLEALRGYRKWREDKEYEDGARLALERLEEGINQAEERDWNSVGAWAYSLRIKLADEINAEDELRRIARNAVEFLEQRFSGLDVHEGNASSVVEAIAESDISPVDDQVIERLVDFCWSRSEHGANNNNYSSQRGYLRRIEQIRNQQGESVDNVHDSIVDSYEEEVELKQGSHLVTGAVLEEAIKDCKGFAGEETLNDWRRRKREANRKGIEEEMERVTVEPTDEEISDLEEACQDMVDGFREICEHESPEAAFLTLVSDQRLIPSADSPSHSSQDNGRDVESSLSDIFLTRIMKSGGDSVSEDVSDLEVSQGYKAIARFYARLTNRVLYLVLEEGLIDEVNFYTFVNSLSAASEDDKMFLTDFVRAFFEKRHAEAVHLGIPRMEGLVRRQLEASGIAVTADKEGEDLPKTLGGLFNLLEDYLSEDYVTFLKYRYTDKGGPEIRNQMAHGSIGYRETNFDISGSILIEIFRLYTRIENIET